MAEPCPPRAPFDDEDADIIFRSSDGVDFRLYKVIVSKLSPILRDTLAAPPPPDVEGLPIVDVSEDARTLEHVFRLCCPVEHPDITTVEDLHAVLEAARKYEMAAVIANVRWIIKRMLPLAPLRLFAIGYMLEMEDVTRDAAVLLRDDPLFHIPNSPPPELALLPALAIYAVHVYRKQCVDVVLRVLDDTDWILSDNHERTLPTVMPVIGELDFSSTWVWMVRNIFADQHSPSCTVGLVQLRVLPSGATYATRQWWCNYMQSLRSALHVRPSGTTVRNHLAMCSDVLREAASCPGCMPRAYADLLLFNTLLAAKIDLAVAEVEIDLPFGKAHCARVEVGHD